jgi:hypothetical protein
MREMTWHRFPRMSLRVSDNIVAYSNVLAEMCPVRTAL